MGFVNVKPILPSEEDEGDQEELNEVEPNYT